MHESDKEEKEAEKVDVVALFVFIGQKLKAGWPCAAAAGAAPSNAPREYNLLHKVTNFSMKEQRTKGKKKKKTEERGQKAGTAVAQGHKEGKG